MVEEMQALVGEYNKLTGKNITRFASVAIGKQRLEKARFDKEHPKPTKKQQRENRSDRVRDQWDDSGVAGKRTQRHDVVVNGSTYGSVTKAMRANGVAKAKNLPAFRLKLKEKGSAIYNHEGKEIHFTAILREKK
jgi:hypothetical protein